MPKGTGKRSELPADVGRHIAEHIALYRSDPEAAHIWDSSVIGLAGPVTTLLLKTKGKVSGKDRYAALQYFRPGGLYVVVASKGGMPTHPAWYLNLLENPDCTIQVGALHTAATARTVEGDERRALWQAVSAEQPAYLKYQTWTEREIPVVIFDLSEPA